jgi:hypothetical protein
MVRYWLLRETQVDSILGQAHVARKNLRKLTKLRSQLPECALDFAATLSRRAKCLAELSVLEILRTG